MKKLTALLLAFVLLFSFAACRDEATTDDFSINDPVIEATPEREDKMKIAVGNDPMGIGLSLIHI